MTKHCLTRIGVDVFINFYEVASVESQGDNDVLIVLKNGHKIELQNTTAAEVNFRLATHVAYINGQTNDASRYGAVSYNHAMRDGFLKVRTHDDDDFIDLKW